MSNPNQNRLATGAIERRGVMKKTIMFMVFCFLALTVQAQGENPLKEGMPNTVKLAGK
jgi:hypothetical protein